VCFVTVALLDIVKDHLQSRWLLPGIGMGMLFEAMAAVVIGGVSLQGGIGKLTGVFAGAILLTAISTAISILGMPPFYMNVIRSNNWWCGAPAD